MRRKFRVILIKNYFLSSKSTRITILNQKTSTFINYVLQHHVAKLPDDERVEMLQSYFYVDKLGISSNDLKELRTAKTKYKTTF